MTRQQETPRQRAEEQLAVAERAATRLQARREQLAAELAQITRDHKQAVARRDHLAQHPDLPHDPTSTPTGEQHP